MSQVFHPASNVLAKLSLVLVLAGAGGGLFLLDRLFRSPYNTEASVSRQQPVPFSHKHHAGELGIDCRYCHTSVEISASAGIPPTQTCMNCHSQIWTWSPTLEPVRASYRTDESIQWTKVYDLPDFVYFNHSVHVAKGVGCVSCHGRVDQMNLTYQVPTLQMGWCLDCHRDPAPNLRPRSEVFNMAWTPPADNPNLGAELMAAHDVHGRIDCTACHR
ncbi:MAG: cytochrome c3 family protein [Deltaproteobacteria bacterium]|nr:cytochrome c3 family protein [Deltaproteobacteria bacterium]